MTVSISYWKLACSLERPSDCFTKCEILLYWNSTRISGNRLFPDRQIEEEIQRPSIDGIAKSLGVHAKISLRSETTCSQLITNFAFFFVGDGIVGLKLSCLLDSQELYSH